MKKALLIFGIIATSLIIACGPSAQEKAEAEKAKADSIAAAEAAAAEAEAAAAQAQADSAANAMNEAPAEAK
jgi:hypothetical protein